MGRGKTRRRSAKSAPKKRKRAPKRRASSKRAPKRRAPKRRASKRGSSQPTLYELRYRDPKWRNAPTDKFGEEYIGCETISGGDAWVPGCPAYDRAQEWMVGMPAVVEQRGGGQLVARDVSETGLTAARPWSPERGYGGYRRRSVRRRW